MALYGSQGSHGAVAPGSQAAKPKALARDGLMVRPAAGMFPGMGNCTKRRKRSLHERGDRNDHALAPSASAENSENHELLGQLPSRHECG
jgi:hypothetical protein